MSLSAFVEKLKNTPDDVSFSETMDIIAKHYEYRPSRFINGCDENRVINEAGSNEGSCKIFAFGLLNKLSEQETLACFGDYYRIDVLQHPEYTDHGNIRQFMKHGWAGIHFDQPALTAR